MKRISLFLPVVVFTMAVLVIAEQNPCVDRTIAVNVLSPDGEFVTNPSVENFHGKLHGQKVEIQSVARDLRPRRVVLVLDASGSMLATWYFVLHAAQGFLDANRENSLALITFSTRVKINADFVQGRKKVAEELDALQNAPSAYKKVGEGGTALHDAIIAAVDLLNPPQFGDVIYVMSDGYDNSSKANDSQVRARLLASQARLFALITSDGQKGRAAPELDGGPQWFHGFVNATGGDSAIFVRAFDSKPGVAPQYSTPLTPSGERILTFATVGVASEIAAVYRLNVKLPSELAKPQDWELMVVDASGKTNKRWKVVYPHEFGPCQ